MSNTAVFSFLSGSIINQDSIGSHYDGPILTDISEVVMRPRSVMLQFASSSAEQDAMNRTGSVKQDDVDDGRLLFNYVKVRTGVTSVLAVQIIKNKRNIEDNLRWEILLDGPTAIMSLGDNFGNEGPSFDGIKRILWEAGTYFICFANQEQVKEAAIKTGLRTQIGRSQNELFVRIVEDKISAYDDEGRTHYYDFMKLAMN